MIPKIELEEAERLKIRFVTRALAVFWVRIALLALGAIVLLVGHKHPTFCSNPLEHIAWIWLLGILAYSTLAHVLTAHEKYGRWVYFSTLNLDLIWCTYLIVYSGGLTSPLMAIGPIYTLLFAVLFPSPITLLPPLLLMPLVTAFDSISFAAKPLPVEIGLLGLFTILNGVVIYLTNYSLSREESQSREILGLERKLKKFAVLEERHRLSREIHDGLGAALSGLIIQSEYLLSIAGKYPNIVPEIREIKTTAEEAIDEVRRALSMMRDDFDLIPQLQNCCATFSARHKLPAHIDINGSPGKLTSDQQLTIFRIMQECLTNISKHAKATYVEIKVDFFPQNALRLNIHDDGVGFDPRSIPRHHYGLLNMRERAKKIGGDILVDSSPGKGTRVSLTVG